MARYGVPNRGSHEAEEEMKKAERLGVD